MRRIKALHLCVAGVVLLPALLTGTPVYAQPVLVDASPAPEAVLPAPPEQIILTFSHPLRDQGTTVQVLDEEGERVDNEDAHVRPENRHTLVVTLPPLFEGVYTVTYTAAGAGDSTLAVGSYQFTVDLPSPRLALLTPVNGQAFESGSIPLQMQVEFFDFGLYNNRIRVYVDGELDAELRSLEYEIEGLEPGVHEITTVLAQFEDQELPETAITVYIAVARPEPELTEGQAAAVASPDAGLQLSLPQVILLAAVTLLLLAVGVRLGLLSEKTGSDDQ